MPPVQKWRNTTLKQSKEGVVEGLYRKYVNLSFVKYLLFDPESLPLISAGILLCELFLNIFVVETVRYTEIDWIAYMQECEGFLNGTTNYALLRGDTGPLVYPGGFVYIYSTLYAITSKGSNIKLAQYIFIFIYLLQMYLVLRLYMKSYRVPPYVLIISAFTSYRIHSIYVLRLFNDPIAILFLYFALNLYLDQQWVLGSIFYSLGVSVKMNILLFAPAVFLLYLTNLGYFGTIKQLFICGLVQLVMGAPFLLTYPVEYLKGSFDLGRIFEHKWTVNYRFLDRSVFESKNFHLSLLILHLLLLVAFARPCFQYFQTYCRLREIQNQFQPQIDRENARLLQKSKRKEKLKKKNNSSNGETLNKEQEQFLKLFENTLKQSSGWMIPPQPEIEFENKQPQKYGIHFEKSTRFALLPLFLCNFIGVACARSLHYQFYIWYFHSLPYLTWYTDYSVGLKFLILGIIELCWNTYPSTFWSSILLHCAHVILLFGIGRILHKTMANSDKFK